jgi:hypothetical protein
VYRPVLAYLVAQQQLEVATEPVDPGFQGSHITFNLPGPGGR